MQNATDILQNYCQHFQNFILKHCSVTDPKRSRKREQEKNKPKSMSVKFYVKRRDGLMVNVYRQSFMNILGVKKDRILNVVKRYKESNEMPKERRGGDRTKGKNNTASGYKRVC
ncbi:unnamed protein product [Acanthoscelides obtectus]|uniref:Uncharacterized protein n=1 Tax=Acanthoscelides obtectus TaxID=200917 RepID=A0A9P0KZI6_ACAOB|nr:unnamed protein product [Acanthoscelides obtectus]CAK1646055.1 hypothetical protein AOBTE_LOCUS14419 [Acanthoscelides obtectus]